MLTFEGLEENFTFMVAEVERQVRATLNFLDAPSHALYDHIVGRDDYIDNLKTVIENKCYGHFHEDEAGRVLDKSTGNRVRAIQVICVNLERVADFCVNIVQQTNYLTDHTFLHSYAYKEMFEEIEACLSRILAAFQQADISGALSVCRAEYGLDRMYKVGFDRIMGELRTGKNVQNLITVLFIFRYLERIGDALLNVGEALIFAILGERIKIEQFEALQQTLTKTGFAGGLTSVDFKAIWGTRSGCRIGRVDSKPFLREGDTGGPGVDPLGSIYKEGAKAKIQAEKAGLELWAKTYPGLVAGVFGFHEEGDKASLLVEFLPGCNLDEVLLTSGEEVLQNAMFITTQTVQDIWETTRTRVEVPAAFMAQLTKRLDAVLQIHPGFDRPEKDVCGHRVAGTRELLASCAAAEKELFAPFSVLIHGDFNVNNLVYNHQTQRLHYLDVHRSRPQDYVQDVSVFLVSNYRMPVFEAHLRGRIHWVMAEFLAFARAFAQEAADATFEARMALALARSLFTSTRFELNPAFSRGMCQRAHYLMERVAEHRGRPWQDFRLPERVLFS
ncbi:MAG TPA: PhoU domain-containing protein [Humidesulfovibrio sp.]|uniref:phosphate signaling complex PhoU family protein n=1 Tax=Humidesulfovibrio sp. TaxID=2910988 RepID=UPI002CA7C97D|nr:PhoU domain-containing protein [Humidesulfovibrio sp.]HWR05065.1 PhoU domain-containing protein [Humidesulfovibrio sp.]